MTPTTDPLIETLNNKWPAHANIFSTYASVGYFIAYPTDHLKHEKLTADQKRKLKPMLDAALAVFSTQQAKDLYQEIKKCYHLDCVLKKFYEDNPSLDKSKFEKISAQLMPGSIGAFGECEYEYGGVPLLREVVEAYLKVNTKEEWSQHIWWISEFYKCAITEKALYQISQDYRKRFKQLTCSFKDLEQELLGKPSLKIKMEQLFKNDEFSKQAAETSDRVTYTACQALLNQQGMQEGLKILKRLSNFTIEYIKFFNE
jgi:hypothetical protein